MGWLSRLLFRGRPRPAPRTRETRWWPTWLPLPQGAMEIRTSVTPETLEIIETGRLPTRPLTGTIDLYAFDRILRSNTESNIRIALLRRLRED